jgi:hypothetical protein
MSQAITARRVVYEMPDEAAVVVRRDIEFSGADGQPLTLDLYLPTDGHVRRTPVVVLIAGFPDAGTVKMLGCRFKEMQSVVSWATLLAASGVAAVAYANREPVGDLAALIDHLTTHAAVLNIDEESVGLLSTSGHGPLGLSLVMRGGPPNLRCAALLYPYSLDLDGAAGVAELSARFGFVNACAGRVLNNLRSDVPMFFARAGQDQFPHLNPSLDRLVAQGLGLNLPLTVVNYPAGVHAFDLMDPSEASRDMVKQALAFFQRHLLNRTARQ